MISAGTLQKQYIIDTFYDIVQKNSRCFLARKVNTQYNYHDVDLTVDMLRTVVIHVYQQPVQDSKYVCTFPVME